MYSVKSSIRAAVLILFLFQACNSPVNQVGFLGLELGMSEAEQSPIIDSLLDNEVILYNKNNEYYHEFEMRDGHAQCLFYLENKRNELEGISIYFGEYDEWNGEEISNLIKTEYLDDIFVQYKKKYGSPDNFSQEDSAFSWTIGHVIIAFTFGEKLFKEIDIDNMHEELSESGQLKKVSFYKYAHIRYLYDSKYLKKKRSVEFQNSI